MMGPADMVGVVERLQRDFDVVVTRRFPEPGRDFDAVATDRYPPFSWEDSKEYWFLLIGSSEALLMRKPPAFPIALGTDDVDLLLRIGRMWGVDLFVGWSWHLWRLSKWFGRFRRS